MQDYEFTVVIEKDEDGRFVAICPALKKAPKATEPPAQNEELQF